MKHLTTIKTSLQATVKGHADKRQQAITFLLIFVPFAIAMLKYGHYHN
jgi:hypothetical protein